MIHGDSPYENLGNHHTRHCPSTLAERADHANRLAEFVFSNPRRKKSVSAREGRGLSQAAAKFGSGGIWVISFDGSCDGGMSDQRVMPSLPEYSEKEDVGG